MTWLVRHAGDVLTKLLIVPDGKTAYERIKGKACAGEAVGFGRKVMHMVPGKPQGGVMVER